jgi:hypothetical protein
MAIVARVVMATVIAAPAVTARAKTARPAAKPAKTAARCPTS